MNVPASSCAFFTISNICFRLILLHRQRELTVIMMRMQNCDHHYEPEEYEWIRRTTCSSGVHVRMHRHCFPLQHVAHIGERVGHLLCHPYTSSSSSSSFMSLYYDDILPIDFSSWLPPFELICARVAVKKLLIIIVVIMMVMVIRMMGMIMTMMCRTIRSRIDLMTVNLCSASITILSN